MNKLKCFVLLLCINEINTPCILKSDDCPVISYTMYVFIFFRSSARLVRRLVQVWVFRIVARAGGVAAEVGDARLQVAAD